MMMSVEMENDLRGKAIIFLMHKLNISELTFSVEELQKVGGEAKMMDLHMRANYATQTISIKTTPVFD